MIVLPRLLALVAALVLAGIGAHVLAAQTGTPAPPEVVIYVDAGRQELARAQVDGVVDPFEDASDATPAEGARFVLVRFTIQNTSDAPLPLEPNTLILRDTDGFLYGPDSALQADLGDTGTPTVSVNAAPLAGGDLAPDEVRTGSLGYAVPEVAELGEVLWVPQAGRLLILARLDVAEAAAGTPEATPARTPRSITVPETATAEATATAAPTEEAAPTTPPEPTTPPAPTTPPEPTPTPDPGTVDTDADGLTDAFEVEIGSDPNSADADGDGLSDFEEYDLGTLIWTTDTDGDGLSDQDEINIGTAPLTVDSDGDGISDGDEYLVNGTDPVAADSDLDGISDLDEINAGSDPADPNSPNPVPGAETAVPTTAPAPEPAPTTAPGTGVDSDGDGLTDEQEASLGTSAGSVDSDGDGLPDGDEVNVYGTSALSGDTDGDGVSDLQEVIAGTNPLGP